MSEPVRKINTYTNPPSGYQPQFVPKAFKVLQGKLEEEAKATEQEAKIITKEGFHIIALKASGRMDNFEAGRAVRHAWKRLQQKLGINDTCWIEKDIGYVFYAQGNMKNSRGEIELRVGVKVDSFDDIPTGFEHIQIPTRKYAMTTCRCQGREQMDRSYGFLNKWIHENGYEIDYNPFAYTLEPNRLTSFNPFEIPADEINAYDFDIYYPIRS